MPNWCEVDLKVEGPVAQLQQFADRVNAGSVRCAYQPRASWLGGKPCEQFEQSGAHIGVAPRYLSQHEYVPKPISILETLIPCPEELEAQTSPYRGTPEEAAALIEKYGHTDWYGWRQANYGVKWPDTAISGADWPLSICYEWEGQGEIEHSFETPWAPPNFSAVSALFPDLTFTLTYFEAGMGFNGRSVYEAGEETEAASGDYFGGRGG